MAPLNGTVICTGTNGGLGSAFVKAFASSPEGSKYQAIYTVRNPSTAHYLNAILKHAPSNHQSEVLALNLSSLKDVRAAAENINARVASGELEPIRALVLNAAFQEANAETKKPKSFTDEGFEMTFGVNYLANFVFVLLLLKSMDKEHGRVVLVSSWTHDSYDNRNDSISIYKEKKYKAMFSNAEELSKGIAYEDGGYKGGMRRYGASKLALVMFFYELQRRIDTTPELSHISVLALDPGAMSTPLSKRSPPFILFLTKWVLWAFQGISVRIAPNGPMRPTWKSANDLLLACFDTQYLGQEPKAVYLGGSAKADSSIESRDETKQRSLWTDTVKMVGLRGVDTSLATLE